MTPTPPPAAVAPATPPAPTPEAPAPVVPAAAVSAPKKRKTWPIIAGVVGVLVIVAVVLVLVLVVFKSPSPSSPVAAFFKAVENRDTTAAMKTVDASYFKGNTGLEATFKKEVLGTMPDNVKFTGMKYSTQVAGDKATVNVTQGNAIYTQDGKRHSIDMTKLDGGNKFDMVKVNGTWYISPTTFGGVFASAFKDSAEKAFKDSIEPRSADIEKAFKSLSAMMSAQPTPSSQQMKAQSAQVEAVLKEYKSACEKTKAEYQKILDLKGSGIEDYKKYAEAAIAFIDTSIKVYDESIEFINYVTDVKAQSEAGATPDVNAYNQKTADFSAKVEELSKKLSDYQQQMTELETKLQ
jgi:hypothetical protein